MSAMIIDLAKVPRKDCDNCMYHDAAQCVCMFPGGYSLDLKSYRCLSFQWREDIAEVFPEFFGRMKEAENDGETIRRASDIRG